MGKCVNFLVSQMWKAVISFWQDKMLQALLIQNSPIFWLKLQKYILEKTIQTVTLK